MAVDNSKLIGVKSNKLPTPKIVESSNTGKLAIAVGEKRDPTIEIPRTPVLALKKAIIRYPQGQFICIQADGNEIVRTYSQMWNQATRILAGLRSLELSPGTPIIFQLNQGHDFAVVFWSCLMGGFIPIPTPAVFSDYAKANQYSERLHYLLETFKDSVVVTTGQASKQVQTILCDVEEHQEANLNDTSGSSPIDIAKRIISIEALDSDSGSYSQKHLFHHSRSDEHALFLLSSGTTGTPKLVTFDAQTLVHRLFVSPTTGSDTQPKSDLRWLPLDHMSGLRIIIPNSAKNIHLATEAVLQSPLIWLDVIQKHQVTHASVTNFFLTMVNEQLALSERTYDLASIKSIFVSAESVVAKTARQFLRQLASHNLSLSAMRIGYGLSECGRVASSGESYFSLESTSDSDAFVEIGRPNCDHSIRIVSSQNYLLEEEEIGQIQVKGPTMTAGYYQDSVRNHSLFTEDGWLNTGDLGFLRDGKLTVTGREKEIIIINALNISSYDVESIVDEVEGIVAGYTIACPVRDQTSSTDKLLVGFHPICFDEDQLTALIQKIRRKIVDQLGINPSYLLPLQKTEVPRTNTGKLQRLELGRHFEGGQFKKLIEQLAFSSQQNLRQDYQEPRTYTEQKLANIWDQVFNLKQIGINDSFFDLGGTSLLSARLIDEIEKQFNRRVPLAALSQLGTIAELGSILDEDTKTEPSVELSAPPKTFSEERLEPEIYRQLLAYTAGWQGQKVRQDSLVVGLNPEGSKQALFWCLQGYRELSQLAKYMGDDQPIYGMRSGHLIMQYTPKNVTDLATYYVEEILAIQPNSPYILGGNCQSAVIISKVAQQLQARGKTITLLCLLENAKFEIYSGKVALFFGRESHLNPYKRFLSPELGWRKAYLAGFSVDLLPCGHGQYFKEPNIQVLAEKLRQSIETAQAEAVQLLPDVGYRAEITCESSITCYVGEKASINVTVKNLSPVSWESTDRSGVMLANHWLDADENVVQWLDASVPLSFDLLPNASVKLVLIVNPPQTPGKYKLSLDLVEEGINWFEKKGSQTTLIDVEVLESSRSLSITAHSAQTAHFSYPKIQPIFPYPHLWESGPFVIGGTGGSGTRVAARIFQACDVFLGENLNAATDALDMIDKKNSWLLPILCHLQSVIPLEVYSQSIKGLAASLEQHLAKLSSKEEVQLWGWKVRPSIFSLPFLHQQFPNIKCLHLVRDGRDMAFSRNQNQLRYLGPSTLTAEEQIWSLPLRSIALWNALNLQTAEYGEQRMPAGQYLRIRFEDLCLAPIETTQKIIKFFGLKGDAEKISQAEISTPKSLKRWMSQDTHIIQRLDVIGEPALQKFGYLAKKPAMQQGFISPAATHTGRHHNAQLNHLSPQAYEAFEQGRFEYSIALCRQLLKELSDPSLQLLQTLGNSYYAVAKYDSALEIYRQAYKRWPEDAKIHLNLGQVYLQQQSFEKAARHFQTALELDIKDVTAAYEGLGLSLEKQQRVDDAITAYQSLLNHYPDYLQTIQKLATLLYKRKQYDDALSYYRHFAALAPDRPFGYRGAGNVLTALGQFDEALEAYQRVLNLQPKHPDIFYQMGNLWVKRKNFEAAEATFQKAITLFPEVAQAQVVLGNFYLHRRQQPIEAERYFRQALILEPQHYIAQKHLGIALMRQDRLGEAIFVLCEAQETYPEKADLYPVLGNFYFKACSWQQAIESYQKAIELKAPNLFIIYYRLGNAFHQLQQQESAIESYHQALQEEFDPIQCQKQTAHIKQQLAKYAGSTSFSV